MADSSSNGWVQTVLGRIAPKSLGITLPHEHFLIDQTLGGVYFVEPDDPGEQLLAHQPVSLENLSWVRYHTKDNLDNQVLDSIEASVEEVALFKREGGRSIVDMTNRGIGRNPIALTRIANETGLNVIMGSGYYANSPLTQDRVSNLGVEDIAREIVDEFSDGVDDTGIRPGIIGELGCSWPLTAHEVKGLEAGVIAQRETGASINVHPGRNDRAPLEILDILTSAGADLSRVVMSHMDRCGYSENARHELLASGCYIEYDLFGFEGYYPARVALAEGKLPETPNDTGRIREIQEHIDEGYATQLLLSHDIGMKVMLVRYGGWGYAHLLREVVPLMKIFGMSQSSIDTMMVDNPRRLLTLR